MQTVLSGIRPTNNLHLGNYLGAVKGMLQLQENPDFETFFMVVDGHAITTPFEPEQLADHRISIIIDYLAAGLNPEESTLFLQSMVPAHFELFFIFSSVMTVARMQHLPTYKDKLAQHPEAATMALLNYPVLMAADILAYQADTVPVGVDQEPHIEVAREIARKLNQQYGTHFPEPQRYATKGEYVPSLTGVGKMSKSVAGSSISLVDDLATIERKLKSVPTDSGKGTLVRTAASHQAKTGAETLSTTYTDQSGTKSPGVASLLSLVELFEGPTVRQAYDQAYESEGLRYLDLKNQLARSIYQQLEPIQQKRAEIEARPEYVTEVIISGAQKAQQRANQTLLQLKQAMGLADIAHA